MGDGPFTDDMVRGILKARQLQHEMIPHMERIAETMAAAGVASQIATGDSPTLAIDRWVEVIRKEAKRLLAEKLREARSVPALAKNHPQLPEQK